VWYGGLGPGVPVGGWRPRGAWVGLGVWGFVVGGVVCGFAGCFWFCGVCCRVGRSSPLGSCGMCYMRSWGTGGGDGGGGGLVLCLFLGVVVT